MSNLGSLQTFKEHISLTLTDVCVLLRIRRFKSYKLFLQATLL